jgi:hypothetical protein
MLRAAEGGGAEGFVLLPSDLISGLTAVSFLETL